MSVEHEIVRKRSDASTDEFVQMLDTAHLAVVPLAVLADDAVPCTDGSAAPPAAIRNVGVEHHAINANIGQHAIGLWHTHKVDGYRNLSKKWSYGPHRPLASSACCVPSRPPQWRSPVVRASSSCFPKARAFSEQSSSLTKRPSTGMFTTSPGTRLGQIKRPPIRRTSTTTRDIVMNRSDTKSDFLQSTPEASSRSHTRLCYVATFGFFFTLLFNLEEHLLGGEYGSRTTFEELDASQVAELVCTLENARAGVELIGNSTVEASEMSGMLDRAAAELRSSRDLGANALEALHDALCIARNAVCNAQSTQRVSLDHLQSEDNGSNRAPTAGIEGRQRALMAFADTYLCYLASMLESLAEPDGSLNSMWMSTVFACTDSAIGMTSSLHKGALDNEASASETLERMRDHLMTMLVEEGGTLAEFVLNAAYQSAADILV